MGNIKVAIGGDTHYVSLPEALSIRDSLCARLGCPTFCGDTNEKVGSTDKVVSTIKVANIKTSGIKNE